MTVTASAVVRRALARAGRVALLALAAWAVLAFAEPAAGTSVVYHGSRQTRLVALTFDDDYSAAAVRAILAILAREHVPATFFPVSSAVRASPALWRAVVRAGHAVGNHTINHPRLTSLSNAALRRQLVVSQAQIRKVTGRLPIPYLRPPYGLYDSRVSRAATVAGFRAIVMWDVDARDWAHLSPRRTMRNAFRGRNGSIVVMHGLPSTVRTLPAIIRHYRQRGFRFVTIPELLQGTTASAARSREARGAAACRRAYVVATIAAVWADVVRVLGVPATVRAQATPCARPPPTRSAGPVESAVFRLSAVRRGGRL